jgi:hypothetical protein
MRRILTTALLAACAVAIASCAGNTSTSSTGSASSGSAAKKSCGFKATDSCTPKVGVHGKVRVDALVWRLVGVRATKTLSNALGATRADGTFIVATVKVHSVKDQSATMTSDVVKLKDGNRTFSGSDKGETAVLASGGEPFLLRDIGPDTTVSGKVVFDVPKSVLRRHPQLQFNELGFGSTHGYIALPALG